MMYRGNVYKYPVRSELHLTGYVFCWASYLVLCSPIVTTTITAIELVRSANRIWDTNLAIDVRRWIGKHRREHRQLRWECSSHVRG